MKKIFSVIITFAAFVNGFSQKHVAVITSFGAKADGVTNNTLAIQHAIDEVAPSGSGKDVMEKIDSTYRCVYS